MKKFGLLIFVLSFGLFGCLKESEYFACYESDDEQGLYLLFMTGEPQSSVTVKDNSGEEPLVTYGMLTEEAFTYADGSKWLFVEGKALGEGGLIEDTTFSALACEGL